MTQNSNNNRIIKNTLILYIRMLFLMFVQLYTSRIVLNTLGIKDYGIYNVVGGIIVMFDFLNNAMIISTQRYITFGLGENNTKRLNQIFITCVNMHLLVSLIIIILGETIGLWFLQNKLVIPAERMDAAFIVYQISILTTIVSIISCPFNAEIVAHEKMSAFAYISILEAILKLVVVYILAVFSFDKLILYAYLIAGVQIFICLCYIVYCRRHFCESYIRPYFNKKLQKEMLNFAGWNLWGNLAAIFMGQGLNILLNIFFGPSVNAARAVSIQVQGAISKFSSNFQMALNPQIIKSYAAGKLDEMHLLVYRSSKITFYLLFIICLPVWIEARMILEIWLKTVPDYTVTFLRIIILIMIIDSTANPLMVSATATGKIKIYQSVIGGILLAILPVAYIVLKLGGSPWSVFIVHLSICIIAFIVRLYLIKPLIYLNVKDYLFKIILRCICVAGISSSIPILLHFYLKRNILNSIIIIIICISFSLFFCFIWGLDRYERNILVEKLQRIKSKTLKR